MSLKTISATTASAIRSLDGGRLVGAVAVGLLVVAAVAMDGAFVMAAMGSSVGAGIVVAVVLGFHGLRARLPFAASGRSLPARASIWSVWTILTALSFAACVGFLAGVRDAVVADRLNASDDVQGIKARLAQDQQRLRGLGAYRDAGVIEAEIAATLAQVSVIPAGSGSRTSSLRPCEPPAPTSSTECQSVLRLRTELAGSRSAEKLKAEIEQTERRRDWTARTSGADPQVEILARLTGLAPDFVQHALVVAIAAMVEIGAGLGAWLVLGGRSAARPSAHAKIAQEGQGGTSPAPRGSGSPARKRHSTTSARPSAARSAPAAPSGNVVPIRGQVERFAQDCLEAADGARATGGEIMAKYTDWCRRNGEQPRRSNDVMPAVKALVGVAPIKGSTGLIEYRGLRLRAA